jgi:excisionase family DNA binding protein
MQREFMKAEEVADYLRISVSSVYKLVRTNQLEATMILNKWRFDKNNVEAYIDKNSSKRQMQIS